MSPDETATVLRETERKYDASPQQELPNLTGLPGVVGDAVIDTVQLSALYYDTADHRLLAAGITLRRREGGDDAGWHMKIPVDGDTRSEWHAPDTEGPSDEVPPSLTHLVKGVTRAHPIIPIALISTDRQRHRYYDADANLLVEVVSDVVISAGGGGDDTELMWREIEVEENPGGRKAAADVDRRLRANDFVRSAFPSKLSRAVGLHVTDSPTDKVASDARALVQQYVAEYARVVAEQDLALRADPNTSVHDFRVAARRVRSALRTYAPRLELSETADPIISELRWAGKELGSARDIEVQWSRLVGRLDELVDVPDRESIRTRLDEHFSTLAATAQTGLTDILDSPRYFELRETLDTFTAALAAGKIGHPKPAKSLLKDLRKVTHNVDARVHATQKSADRHHRDEAVHRARKGAKRLRYAIEVSAPLSRKKAARALRALAQFQTLLGEYQDSVVATEHLREIVGSAQPSPTVAFGLGMMYQHELDLTDELFAQLDRRWLAANKRVRKVWKN